MLLSNLSVGSRSNVSCHSKGEKTVNDNASDASNISRGGRTSKIPRLFSRKTPARNNSGMEHPRLKDSDLENRSSLPL